MGPILLICWPSLTLATVNPGRTGLTALGTGQVLWWRLELLASNLQQSNTLLAAVPGARLYPGLSLPEGFPYEVMGNVTGSWDDVCVFVSTDIGSQQVELCDFNGERRIFWLRIPPSPKHESAGFSVCSVYAKHGGDVDTMTLVVQHAAAIQALYPDDAIIIMGDLNFHIKDFLPHDRSCKCAHCKQSASDRQIENMLRVAGFQCYNVPSSTQVSGTAIDYIWCNHFLQARGIVDEDYIAL